ncbi:MAG: helix-turn-helix transcriptional regulator [Clostridia bacterium]|nr:helix-turn-helix transcriptional regulator [Clostridia bacterium]
MELNQAVSQRLQELLDEREMTYYQLHIRSGVPKSTISNLINCAYDSVKLRILHEVCQGLNVDLVEFFHSPLFNESNLEP